MDFAVPPSMSKELDRFREFINTHVKPDLKSWTRQRELPPAFFQVMGEGGWFGLRFRDGFKGGPDGRRTGRSFAGCRHRRSGAC